jgi:NAD(P)-dependent dehydrogenase (short-subunit alcohol dehydrogenase family)
MRSTAQLVTSQSRRGSQFHIVITASAASFLDSPPLHMYSTAKAGLLGMIRSLRNDLAKQGITINLVAPWVTCKNTSYIF